MLYFPNSGQPLFFFLNVFGLSLAIFFQAAQLNLNRASAETPLGIGDQVKTLSDLATLPDGPHQLCSEPEQQNYQATGTCYWFTKTGNYLIGYFGIPHSDIFIDCLSGDIHAHKIIGEAIAITWEGVPLASAGQGKPFTWRTLSLGAGTIEYKQNNDQIEISLIKFDQAELTLRNYYRYDPTQVGHMNAIPTSCSVQDWVKQIALN